MGARAFTAYSSLLHIHIRLRNGHLFEICIYGNILRVYQCFCSVFFCFLLRIVSKMASPNELIIMSKCIFDSCMLASYLRHSLGTNLNMLYRIRCRCTYGHISVRGNNRTKKKKTKKERKNEHPQHRTYTYVSTEMFN